MTSVVNDACCFVVQCVVCFVLLSKARLPHTPTRVMTHPVPYRIGRGAAGLGKGAVQASQGSPLSDLSACGCGGQWRLRGQRGPRVLGSCNARLEIGFVMSCSCSRSWQGGPRSLCTLDSEWSPAITPGPSWPLLGPSWAHPSSWRPPPAAPETHCHLHRRFLFLAPSQLAASLEFLPTSYHSFTFVDVRIILALVLVPFSPPLP